MSNYTSNLDDRMWDIRSFDDNDDFSSVTEFLNSKDNFRPFGTRLAIFIAQKLNIFSTDSKTLRSALMQQCKNNGVALSEIASYNTLDNWFEKKGDGPNKGDDSARKKMFALAFALQLSIYETKDLFHKVFLDRAFNFRDEKELIYYFCLLNNKTWENATRLIAIAESSSKDYSDNTKLTNVIADKAGSFQEDDLLNYIRENGHNFGKNCVTAKKKFEKYLEEARIRAQEETIRIRKPEDEEKEREKEEQRKKGYKYESAEEKKGSFYHRWINNFSNNLLFEAITGADVTGKKGTKTVFKNSEFPKEIKTRFPEARTFGKDDMTSEEYRKVIILLFFYCQWFDFQNSYMDYDSDNFEKEMNNLLHECRFPPLYQGNPFDWLFMFCAREDQPLESFQEIIAAVLRNN